VGETAEERYAAFADEQSLRYSTRPLAMRILPIGR